MAIWTDDPRYCSEEEYLTLNQEQQEILLNLIKSHLRPASCFNYKFTSYGLKHALQRMAHFYVSNADAKKAMTDAGFRSRPSDWPPNWYFNVTHQSWYSFGVEKKKRGKNRL